MPFCAEIYYTSLTDAFKPWQIDCMLADLRSSTRRATRTNKMNQVPAPRAQDRTVLTRRSCLRLSKLRLINSLRRQVLQNLQKDQSTLNGPLPTTFAATAQDARLDRRFSGHSPTSRLPRDQVLNPTRCLPISPVLSSLRWSAPIAQMVSMIPKLIPVRHLAR